MAGDMTGSYKEIEVDEFDIEWLKDKMVAMETNDWKHGQRVTLETLESNTIEAK